MFAFKYTFFVTTIFLSLFVLGNTLECYSCNSCTSVGLETESCSPGTSGGSTTPSGGGSTGPSTESPPPSSESPPPSSESPPPSSESPPPSSESPPPSSESPPPSSESPPPSSESPLPSSESPPPSSESPPPSSVSAEPPTVPTVRSINVVFSEDGARYMNINPFKNFRSRSLKQDSSTGFCVKYTDKDGNVNRGCASESSTEYCTSTFGDGAVCDFCQDKDFCNSSGKFFISMTMMLFSILTYILV